MRRYFSLFLVLFSALILSGCTGADGPKEILPEDLITMANLDEYLFRGDVQYVDLRNFDDKFNVGYIESFESIPFFDYLDNRVFDRGNIMEFEESHIIDDEELFRLFDKDKAILLYAGGCTRSYYVRDALVSLGYTRVYNLGGFFDYTGDHKVLGVGNYQLGNQFYSTIDNGGLKYIVSGYLDLDKKITEIRFDVLDTDSYSVRSLEYDADNNYNSLFFSFEDFIIGEALTFNELYDEITLYETNDFGSKVNDLNLYINGIISVIDSLVVN